MTTNRDCIVYVSATAAACLLIASSLQAGGRNDVRATQEEIYTTDAIEVPASAGRNSAPRSSAAYSTALQLNECQGTSGRNAARGAEISTVTSCDPEVVVD